MGGYVYLLPWIGLNCAVGNDDRNPAHESVWLPDARTVASQTRFKGIERF